jgi:hypothetical protein
MGSAKTLARACRRAAFAWRSARAERVHVRRLATRSGGSWKLGLPLALVVTLACAQLQLALNKPGERNKTFPEKVAKQYHCDRRPLPFVEIEKSDLVPNTLQPGGQFHHRLVYVMCPAKSTDVVAGTLHTRVLFEGRVIDRDKNPFKFKPGRWEIVDLFDVQELAQPGVYSFAIVFEESAAKNARRLERESTFIVEMP